MFKCEVFKSYHITSRRLISPGRSPVVRRGVWLTGAGEQDRMVDPAITIRRTMNEVIDRIVKLLASGLNRDEVYRDIYSKCTLTLRTKNQQQLLSDLIAQIDARSVFAVGTIPTKENDEKQSTR